MCLLNVVLGSSFLGDGGFSWCVTVNVLFLSWPTEPTFQSEWKEHSLHINWVHQVKSLGSFHALQSLVSLCDRTCQTCHSITCVARMTLCLWRIKAPNSLSPVNLSLINTYASFSWFLLWNYLFPLLYRLYFEPTKPSGRAEYKTTMEGWCSIALSQEVFLVISSPSHCDA